jgi:hypothetical protein
MNRLFFPKKMRLKISHTLYRSLLVLGVLFLLIGSILFGLVIQNRQQIEDVNLLANKNLLMLRIAAKRDETKREEYYAYAESLSREYRNKRGKHAPYFMGAVTFILAGALSLKIRKNLRFIPIPK